MNAFRTRRWMSLGGLALMAGCAGLQMLQADVSTFGEWPSGRSPGSYAFERLPSQQARLDDQQQLEVAAQAALSRAGFKPAANGAEADVLVQVGARTSRIDRSPWDDPLWWHGGIGVGYGRLGPWLGPRWNLSARLDSLRYDREVALLIRDRSSGKPLFEARAEHQSTRSVDSAQLAALFDAALKDFPLLGLNPRRVSVDLTR